MNSELYLKRAWVALKYVKGSSQISDSQSSERNKKGKQSHVTIVPNAKQQWKKYSQNSALFLPDDGAGRGPQRTLPVETYWRLGKIPDGSPSKVLKGDKASNLGKCEKFPMLRADFRKINSQFSPKLNKNAKKLHSRDVFSIALIKHPKAKRSTCPGWKLTHSPTNCYQISKIPDFVPKEKRNKHLDFQIKHQILQLIKNLVLNFDILTLRICYILFSATVLLP